jgi:hypothetical protein
VYYLSCFTMEIMLSSRAEGRQAKHAPGESFSSVISLQFVKPFIPILSVHIRIRQRGSIEPHDMNNCCLALAVVLFDYEVMIV